jgi:hypothetical protein
MSDALDINEDKLFAISLQYQCPFKWQNMKGGAQVRHCTACKQNVYNLSNMSRKNAVRLIQEKEGNLCVRFYQRRDGTVITRDCASIVGKDNLKQKWNIFALANAGLAFMATVLLPMLGPACVTIVQGVGPVMRSSGGGSNPIYDDSDMPQGEVHTDPPPTAAVAKEVPINPMANLINNGWQKFRDLTVRPGKD